jgi:hypothetical protein
VKDFISGIGADVIINRCVDTLDPFFCAWSIATPQGRSGCRPRAS